MSYGYPYPYQQPQRPQQMQTLITGYSVRPVADEGEARAVPTDFNGTTLVMVDQAHGFIYTKALNPVDGSPVFLTYRLQQPVVQAPVEYATTAMLAALQKELKELKALLAIDDTGGGQ